MIDFGIAGKTAVVCASSKGLGYGCADALAAVGVNLVMNGRSEDTLAAAAARIRDAHGVKVTEVPADITTPEGRAAVLEAAGHVDILVNNAGGPPPGDFRDWTRETWITALDANMLAAFDLIKAVVDPMIENRFGRIVNITSGSVKSPIAQLGLSNGARAGLTGFVAGIARKTVEHNVTINALLPGPFDTDRLAGTAKAAAAKTGKSIEAVLDERRQSNPAKRFGTIEEFGAACAFLASSHAGYITGQNLLLDGGAFPGTL